MRKSSEDYQPVAAAKTPEMERSVSPTSPGKEGKDSSYQSILRKRKNVQKEVITSDAASLSNKRPRENIQPSSSPPRGGGTTFTSKSGISHGDNAEERRIKTQFSNGNFSGVPHFVPPNLSKEKKATTARSDLSEAHGATSAYGSGLANRSTVTTSSIEEGSIVLHSSAQTSNTVKETDTVGVVSQTITQATDFGSTCQRPGNHNDSQHRDKLALGHRERERRKSSLGDDHLHGEVLSPFSSFFGNLPARDGKVDTVSGSNLQDVSYRATSQKTETTCVVNSKCSSIEAGRRGSARRPTDYVCLIPKWEDSSDLGLSSYTRVLSGSSTIPDLSSCSESVLSGMANAYKLYEPMEPSRTKGSLQIFSERRSAVDETLAVHGPYATDEFKSKARRFQTTPTSSYQLSQDGSSTSSEDEPENCSGPMEVKPSGEGPHALVEYSFEQGRAPTFVLSSGRMSKDEAIQIGRRPPTIDDDFEQYFAQLML